MSSRGAHLEEDSANHESGATVPRLVSPLGSPLPPGAARSPPQNYAQTTPKAPSVSGIPESPQRLSPVSPSPVRPVPSDSGLHGRPSDDPDSSKITVPGYTSPQRAPTVPHSLASLPSSTVPSLGSHEHADPPIIRFDVLANHDVPADTINYLKRFVEHHSRQTRKLRQLGDGLRVLRSDVEGTREHAVSLTARVDRSMSDAARYLLESEDQLATLSMAFDQPRSGMSPNTLRTMSPGAASALRAADPIIPPAHVHNTPAPQVTEEPEENDDLYAASQPSVHDAPHRQITAPHHLEASVRSRTETNSSRSSQQNSQSHRRPNETDDQFVARQQAEMRLAERAQTAWYRAFPGTQPDTEPDANNQHVPPVARAPTTISDAPYRSRQEGTAGLSRDRATDARCHSEDEATPDYLGRRPRRAAEIPGPPHRPDVRFQDSLDSLHPAVSAGPMGPEYDSISRPPMGSRPPAAAVDPYSSLYVRPQGLSAYRISQTPAAGGLWNSDQYHFVVLIDKVVKLVNHKVGDAFEAPPGLKVPKIPDPRKYSGSSSHEEFMDWLGEFLNWLRGNYICGPPCDPLRINYLGLYLSGSASDWYLTEIDNPDRSFHPALKFVDCVALLHKRFVRAATANNAVILYNAVRYNAKDGVEGLYYQLDRAASKMIERPSDYSFRSRLFNCLPHWMQKLLLTRNITPEYHQLIDIRENARQIEENSLRKYEGLEEHSTSNASGGHAASTKVPRASPAPKPTSNRAPVRPAVDAKASASPRAARPPKATGTRDTSTMTCYSCGAVGHISTQPVCPNYDQNNARLHAQWEVEDDQAAEVNDHDAANVPGPEDYAHTWGGSQYESEDDAALADNEADDRASDGDMARVARMYADTGPRLCVMRVEDSDEEDELADDEGELCGSIGTVGGEEGIADWSLPGATPRGTERALLNRRESTPVQSQIFAVSMDVDYRSLPVQEDDAIRLSLSGEDLPALEPIANDAPTGSDRDTDDEMPALLSASDSEDADTDNHGSESEPMSESEDGSSSDASTDMSSFTDYVVPQFIPPPQEAGGAVHYMDDTLHAPAVGLQTHDYPTQRITRPSTYRVIQDLRPTFERTPSVGVLPHSLISDRGPTPHPSLGLVVRWRYVGRAPEAHFPYTDTVKFLTPTVWVDTQERFLDFWDGGDLHEYNELVARIVYCMACGGECQPIVIQQLTQLPHRLDGAVHQTTYLCTAGGSAPAPPEQYPNSVEELHSFHSDTLMAMRVVHSATVRRPMGDISGRISRPKQSHTTITCLIDINGHKALALFDSGSTTDSVTPEFAFVSKLKQFTLPEQVTLQLGCIGSRSKICYGTVAPVDILGVRTEMYFDLINIDRYDAILGTPFLEKHGVCLDFKRKAVVIDGTAHGTFSVDEEIAYLAKRGGVEKRMRGQRPAPRDTAPIPQRRGPAPTTPDSI
ncbi:hypothetical protein HWV62_135 [Athelia sp. TMB]|nr:hypothetical protein HWV62_135 [Athelia sp. TMB]